MSGTPRNLRARRKAREAERVALVRAVMVSRETTERAAQAAERGNW